MTTNKQIGSYTRTDAKNETFSHPKPKHEIIPPFANFFVTMKLLFYIDDCFPDISIDKMEQDHAEKNEDEPEPQTKSQKVSLEKSKLRMNTWECRVDDKTFYLTRGNKSCPICFKLFVTGYNMRRHITYEHVRSGRFQCQLCEKSYASETALTNHCSKIHTGENVPPKKSRKKNAVKNPYNIYLTSYKKKNKSEDKEQCPDCPKLITKSHFLRHRYEVHHIANVDTNLTRAPHYPFKCKECPFETKRNYDLKRHMKQKHNPERSYMCLDCEKSYEYKSSLARHIKIHNLQRLKEGCPAVRERKRSLGVVNH